MRKLLLVGIVFFFIGKAYSQLNSKLIRSSLFVNYTVSNGLSDEKIHAVFQDSRGWIWLGTDYGALRFDGYTFAQFTIYDTLSEVLSNSLIRTFYEDSEGIFWIGTDFQGLFKYNREQNTLEQFKDKGFTHNSVWQIIEDKKKNLWLGTESGLNYFNPHTGQIEQTYTAENHDGFPANWIRKLYMNDDDLWVGTNKGIVVLSSDGKVINQSLIDEKFAERENEIWEIFKDKSGNLWIGTYLGGMYKYHTQTKSLERIVIDKNNVRANTVRSIIQDKQGDYWIGTRGGLYFLSSNLQTVQLFENEQFNNFSLIHNSVLNLFIDKKGDLWVGTRNGLSYLNFDRQAFGYIQAKENEKQSLNNGEVYIFWEDPQKRLWIGTESGGINIFNPRFDEITYLTTKQGLSSNCIKSICPDNSGNVLIGTYLGGLNIYNPINGKVTILKHEPSNSNSLSDNEVWCILKDSKKQIWIGTSKGVDLFDEKTLSFKHLGPKYNLELVSMIYEDNRQSLWIFSPDMDRMTVIFNNGNSKVLPIKSRAMCEDNNGNFWFATMGKGLIKMNQNYEIIEEFNTENGLCSNILNGVININNENLWLSSNNGVACFHIQSKEIKNFYSSDGLLNDKFNYGAFFKTTNNILAFGGKLGVDFIYLDKLQKNSYLPPVAITGFRLFNKKIEPNGQNPILTKAISETRQITLKYHQNMFSFDFAALNYANSNKNSYKYILEGFDKNWNDIGNNRVATYTNINHGDYVLKVIGSNNDNLFNEQGVSLAITILPPFWKSWWFRLIAIGLLILLFYFIFIMIRNREVLKQELIYERQTARKMQDVDRIKHQFFMNISHEIRTPLSLIAGPIDKLIAMNFESETIIKNLQIIKRNSNNLKKLVNQLLDYRKLETGNLKLDLRKGNLRMFLEEIVDSFRASAREKEIDIEFNASQPAFFVWFDADIIEKIVNNLLSNAIKYTLHNGSVIVSITSVFADDLEDANLLIPPFDIELAKNNKFVKIRVADSGVGISSENLPRIFDRFRRIEQPEQQQPQGTGIGLALTKELVKLHNGHLKVRSKIGKGTRFSVFIPFDDHDLTEADVDALNADSDKNKIESGNKNQLIALVVDDNADVREFIKTHFEPEYYIIEAKNGREAWELTLDKMPDIIISDVMMPVMDGNELCKKIKHDERTSHIPLIMLSALSSNDKQLAGIDAGADDYLTKPFDVGLLKAKADNLLSIRKALRERYSKELVLKPKDIVLASPDEKFLKRLITLIEKNISMEMLDVEYLSVHMDVSRTQLYRKISALTDMTPKEFVKDIRLKRAAQLIIQNRLNISEVGYDVGFSDTSYFRKCFKEKFGMSASEYKRKHSS